MPDFTQRPLSSMTSYHKNGQGVVERVTLIDFITKPAIEHEWNLITGEHRAHYIVATKEGNVPIAELVAQG